MLGVGITDAEHDDIVGDRMPFGGPSLAGTDIDVIRTWIAQDAPNN